MVEVSKSLVKEWDGLYHERLDSMKTLSINSSPAWLINDKALDKYKVESDNTKHIITSPAYISVFGFDHSHL